MGVSIYYKGKVNQADQVNHMIEELAKISEELNWKYETVDDTNLKVRGIIIRPHDKSETFSVLINQNLHLISIGALIFKKPNQKNSRIAAIKTQYAPLDIHIGVIKLLRYLKKKYIHDLEVFDEGNYWETMDENILSEKINFLTSRINLVGDILDAHKNEFEKLGTPKKVADKIEELLKKYGYKRSDKS